MNYRKGLTRIAIVWIAVWGLWGWSGHQINEDAERGFMEASAKHDDLMLRYHSNMMTRGEEQISQAVNYGLLMPIGLLVVAGLAFWIWRGFKPKLKNGSD